MLKQRDELRSLVSIVLVLETPLEKNLLVPFYWGILPHNIWSSHGQNKGWVSRILGISKLFWGKMFTAVLPESRNVAGIIPLAKKTVGLYFLQQWLAQFFFTYDRGGAGTGDSP